MRYLIALLLFFGMGARAAETEFLKPEQAFQFVAQAIDARSVEVRFQIAPGYYMYRERFKFVSVEPGVTLGAPEIPPGKKKHDETFGDVETYHDGLVIRLPLAKREPGTQTLILRVTSQGCADAGLCYPPQNQQVRVELPSDQGALEPAAPQAASGSGTGAAGGQGGSADVGSVVGLLSKGALWLKLVSFFGFGLLLSLTPCVFPLIPILSGIIVGRGPQAEPRHGFSLSVAYVLGMAITYAVAGVLAGLSGTLLSSALQNAWVLGAFAAVFIALAMSMFGFYELQLPGAMQTRVSEWSGRLPGGRYSGVFAMGALSALIVGPCVAAPLAGALLYISKTRDVLLGGAALFFMAVGMGVPLLLVGASSGKLLPHVGPWMEAVKKFFGVILLGVALWLVSPVLPGAAVMLMLAAMLIIAAMYLHAIDPLPHNAKGFQRFAKGVGVIALLWGGATLLGALAGNRDVLQPFRLFNGVEFAAQTGQAGTTGFERVRTLEELDSRLRSAGRPVLVDFYADWCVSCKEMERFTFADPGVKRRFRDFVLLQVDVTENSDADRRLLQRFDLFGPPGIVFFDDTGTEVRHARVVGFQPADQFLQTLEQLRRVRG